MTPAFAPATGCPVSSRSGGDLRHDTTAAGPYAHTLEVLLKSISEGFYGIDRDGRCVFINRAGAETLGYEPEQLVGREMHSLIHRSHEPGTPPAAQDCPFYRAVIHGESCCIDSERLWRADGSSFPVEYSVSPIVEGGRVITGAVVTFRDISDRKQAEASQRRMHDELERRVEERTQELHDALQELGRTTERLRELSAHVENACELDRKRIAREIHDELGSVLVALKLDLSWLRGRVTDELAAKTRTMTRLIDKAVVEVGRIITDLRPSILDHQGLWAAMEWHAQEFIESSGLHGSVQLDVADREPPGGALGTAAYRIFQEMLNNVVRHARATSIDIQVCANDQRLRIVVSDNGRGITEQQLHGRRSYGLIGMCERARHFGGELKISASGSGGTCITVRLPYAEIATTETLHDSLADL